MCLHRTTIIDRKNAKPIQIPCGRCIECLEQYSNAYVTRILEEKKRWNITSFLTLTYAENPKELNKKDFQDFMKRLRKHLEPAKIKYFACGEYGSKGQRPHYHCILFGYIPKNEELQKIWRKGFVYIEPILTEKIAKYCTKYLQKLNDLNEHEIKPFLLISNDLGNNFDRNIALSGYIYQNGKKKLLPRYYLVKLKQQGYNVDKIKLNWEPLQQLKLDNNKANNWQQWEKKRKKSINFGCESQ